MAFGVDGFWTTGGWCRLVEDGEGCIQNLHQPSPSFTKMLGAGIEPARGCPRGILSPLRLPISPPEPTENYSRSVRAPTEAFTSLIGGVFPYPRSYARSIAGIVFLSVLFTSTIATPPHPAPVSRAPTAPTRFAAATTVSSSGQLHSYSPRHDSSDS